MRDYKEISFQAPSDLLRWYRKHSKAQRLPVSLIVRDALERYREQCEAAGRLLFRENAYESADWSHTDRFEE